MGIYIFTYDLLRKALVEDAKTDSSHDFGKDILPGLLNDGKRLFAYPFEGYWKDVGTIHSLWEANMDLLDPDCTLRLFSSQFKIYSDDTFSRPQFIDSNASVKDSIINQGAVIKGDVSHCVISNEVYVEEGASVVNCAVMPGAVIKKGVHVENALVGPYITVDHDIIGNEEDVALVNGEE